MENANSQIKGKLECKIQTLTKYKLECSANFNIEYKLECRIPKSPMKYVQHKITKLNLADIRRHR
jgi:hypothetical protein